MNISREEKKVEAIRRMEKVGYWKRAKEAFRRQNKVFVNEPPVGAVYDLEPDLADKVREFEEEYDALVYMVVRSFMWFGVCDSLLYVSDHEEEWDQDMDDLRNGYAFTYTINKDAPDCSEFGTIGIRLGAGAGLVRVA
jgi:hypothetical protein